MDAASSIAALGGTLTLHVTRPGEGQLVDPLFSVIDGGRIEPGPTSTFDIVAVLYPPKSQDLLRLPEGRRSEKVIALFTGTELKTAGAPGGSGADLVEHAGEVFEVEAVDDWSQHGGYYHALAVRVA